MENNEVIEEIIEEIETPTEELGGENEEIESGNDTSLLPLASVSDGNAILSGGEDTETQIVTEITIDGAEVYVVQEYTLIGEYAKPLTEYSVTEGLLLCIFLVLLGQAITRIIGGVLNCKHLFKA